MKIPKYTSEWTELDDMFKNITCRICPHWKDDEDIEGICGVNPCIANEQEYDDKFDKLRNLLEVTYETY